jgi:hypothetical protein
MCRAKHFLTIIFLAFAFCWIGCGGGSSGTGTKVIGGSVRSEKDQPISGALVTILNNGDSAVTDSQGVFAIESKVEDAEIQLEIQTATFRDTVEVSNTIDDSARIELDVTVDEEDNSASVEDVSATAKIVGFCDFAFENRSIIRQSNKLKPGTQCTLKVSVETKKRPVTRAPFVIQARGCAGLLPWLTEAQGTTRRNGIGQLQFTFQDDAPHCEYRVVVPYQLKGVKSVIFPIHTFSKQEFDRGVK